MLESFPMHITDCTISARKMGASQPSFMHEHFKLRGFMSKWLLRPLLVHAYSTLNWVLRNLLSPIWMVDMLPH